MDERAATQLRCFESWKHRAPVLPERWCEAWSDFGRTYPLSLDSMTVSEDNPFWIQEDGGDHYNWFLDTAMVGNPEVAMIFHPGGLQAPDSVEVYEKPVTSRFLWIGAHRAHCGLWAVWVPNSGTYISEHWAPCCLSLLLSAPHALHSGPGDVPT
uniref:Uncharacterized protein n=1 Tax=Ailuropoda melanoleuca TaxID=9646 RepID=D2IDZ9_AILME|nr:hypothetical protein [Ailuropoda melanoleuca]